MPCTCLYCIYTFLGVTFQINGFQFRVKVRGREGRSVAQAHPGISSALTGEFYGGRTAIFLFASGVSQFPTMTTVLLFSPRFS